MLAMAPVPERVTSRSMLLSTSLCRNLARSGLTAGLWHTGFCGTPASMATSAMLSSDKALPK
jgi:hypothetical protein